MSINQFWYANGYVFWAFHLPAEVIERSDALSEVEVSKCRQV